MAKRKWNIKRNHEITWYRYSLNVFDKSETISCSKTVLIDAHGWHYTCTCRSEQRHWVGSMWLASASLVSHTSWLAESQKDRFYSTNQSQGVFSLSTSSGTVEADSLAVGWDLPQVLWIWSALIFWGHHCRNLICSLPQHHFPCWFHYNNVVFFLRSFKILSYFRSPIIGRWAKMYELER